MYPTRSSNQSAICCLVIILGCTPCPERCRQYAGNCMDFGWWCQLASSATGEPCLDVPAFHSCCRHWSGLTLYTFFIFRLSQTLKSHLALHHLGLYTEARNNACCSCRCSMWHDQRVSPSRCRRFMHCQHDGCFLNVLLSPRRKDLFLHCWGNLSRRCPEWAFWVMVCDESPLREERSSVPLKLSAGYFDNSVRRLRVGKEEDGKGAKSYDIEGAVTLG